jgi:methyltransferase
MRRKGFTRVDMGLSYPLMIAVHVSWFTALVLERFFPVQSIPAAIQWIAVCVFAAAQALRFWAIKSLGYQWNTQVMNPQQAEVDPGIVSAGPYRYIRHPNYLAVILEFLSLPLLGGALVTMLVWSAFNGVVLAHRIKLEEQHLQSRPGYQHSVGQLPRLIPRLYRGSNLP